ncbi:MAG: VTT domain-containing protein [Chloroflexota bacterium]|nr:VTT domain-containing protein [Chloroflexota bacterium]
MFDFIDQITNWIIISIGDKGPLFIFLGGLIEQVIVPLPSPLIAMAGGFLLIDQSLPTLQALQEVFLKVSLPYTAAATLGLGIVYFIAYFGGKPLIDRFEGWLGFSWRNIEQLQTKFRGNWWDGILLVALRAIPVIPISLVSGVAGAIRFPVFRFYLLSTIGVLIRSFLLGLIGWQTGEAYQAMAEGIEQVEDYVTVGLVILIAALLFWGYRRRERFLEARTARQAK